MRNSAIIQGSTTAWTDSLRFNHDQRDQYNNSSLILKKGESFMQENNNFRISKEVLFSTQYRDNLGKAKLYLNKLSK
jgi:hypothetical protein